MTGPREGGQAPATLSVLIVCAAAAVVRAQEARVPDTQTLQQMAARFAPTDITADLSKMSDADRRVLAKLVEASKIVDALFLRQVWSGNEAMLMDLTARLGGRLLDPLKTTVVQDQRCMTTWVIKKDL